MFKNIYKYLRSEYYKKIVYWGKNIRFRKGVYLDNHCKFEGYNSVSFYTKIINCNIGLGSYIGEDVHFQSTQIGRFCSIGSRIRTITGRHPTNTYVSTHPAFFSTGKQAGFTFSEKKLFPENKRVNDKYLVVIGNDVWIGDNVLILDGVSIGDGAIIGAGTVVSKNIEPYSINVGNPIKIIGYRFNKDDIEFLLNNKWWLNELKWIKENHRVLCNIADYKSLLNE